MSKDLKKMFESINSKEAAAPKAAETKTSNTIYCNKTVDKQETTYVLRLLPNSKDPQKTVVNVETLNFMSNRTGKVVFINSPQTFGRYDKDPIEDWRWLQYNDYKKSNFTDMKAYGRFKEIERKSNTYVNCYVIRDPHTPENEGKVMKYKLPRDIIDKFPQEFREKFKQELGIRDRKKTDKPDDTKKKVIDDSVPTKKVKETLKWEDIFNPYNGCDLVIVATPKTFTDKRGVKVENAPDYGDSYFSDVSRPLVKRVKQEDGSFKTVELSEAEIDKVLDETIDLEADFRVPTPEDVGQFFADHFLGHHVVEKPSTPAPAVVAKPAASAPAEKSAPAEEDDIPMSDTPKPTKKPVVSDEDDPFLNELNNM